MSFDTDYAAEFASHTPLRPPGTTTGTAEDIRRIATNAATTIGTTVSDGARKLRGMYQDDPTRAVAIGAIALAGLAAMLVTLVRRH